MQKTLLAAAIALTATGAFAGSSEAPAMDVTVITQSSSATSLSHGWIVPATLAFILILSAGGGGHRYDS